MELIKNYDLNNRYGVHKIEIVLQAWDYRKTLIYEIGGNCKGLSVLDVDIEEVLEQLGFYNDEDDEGCTIYLENDNGDTLEYDISDERELESIIVSVRIVDYIEKEE